MYVTVPDTPPGHHLHDGRDMPTTQVSNGLSPLSETTSDSSPGPSPKRHCFQDSPTSASTIEAVSLRGFAARACEKCRASKRKCDKKLPFCDRCKRLNAKCHYVQDINNNVTPQGAQFVIYQPRSLSNDALFRGTEPLESITASQILSLVSASASPGVPPTDWRSAINTYFVVIHPWYAVVHPTLFDQQMATLRTAVDSPPQSDTPVSLTNGHMDHQLSVSGPGYPYQMPKTDTMVSKELALLVVAMYLNTRMRLTDAGEQPIFDETYRTVKRLLSSLLLACVGDPQPSIEVVQCGALVALYEYGHGDALTAYRTLSQTALTARILDIKPGQVSEHSSDAVMLGVEEEQSGCLWWGMFILDQFIHQDDETRYLPFLLESPSRNTLLPETPPMTPIEPIANFPLSPPPAGPLATHQQQQQQEHLSASAVVGTTKFGSFQLSAKSASLFHRAIRIDKERDARPGKMPLVATYADLDAEIRATTLSLLAETLDWEAALDCFAMLVSALFTLYLPYLAILEHRGGLLADPGEGVGVGEEGGREELRTALAALRFACKMSTDISCKVNADFERAPRSPALLCAPAGNTCFYVILAFASLRRIFPGERDECEANIAEKFESLKLFSFRWGIAEKMMSRLEKRIGVDRNYYLQNSLLTPPPHSVCFDLTPR